MRVPSLTAAVVLGLLTSPHSARGQLSSLVRVSTDSAGLQSNGDSRIPALSADGNWVAFVSVADNLVPDDRNGQSDIYLHDLRTGATTRVSVSNSGEEAQLECVSPVVSADGRLVTFQSDSANLVTGDTNGFADIFVRDTQLGTTTRVSVGPQGIEATLPCVSPSMSADGQSVAFLSYSTNLGGGPSGGIQDVFVRDFVHGTTECVSVGGHDEPANDSSFSPSLSADGRLVAFASEASNLVPGDLNGSYDVFVRDRRSGRTELVSLSTSGAPGNSMSLDCRISGDGRWVVFTSYASSLIPFDDNTVSDVLVHDRRTGLTELVSQNTAGQIGNEKSDSGNISNDGRWVVFSSYADNLGAEPDGNQTGDVFLRDRVLGVTTRLSIGLHLVEGDQVSRGAVIAADGALVAFESWAANLVAQDTNRADDVFVHGLR